MEKEFIIIGKYDGQPNEQVLATVFNGKNITDIVTAERIELRLIKFYKCTDTRIETVRKTYVNIIVAHLINSHHA